MAAKTRTAAGPAVIFGPENGDRRQRRLRPRSAKHRRHQAARGFAPGDTHATGLPGKRRTTAANHAIAAAIPRGLMTPATPGGAFLRSHLPGGVGARTFGARTPSDLAFFDAGAGAVGALTGGNDARLQPVAGRRSRAAVCGGRLGPLHPARTPARAGRLHRHPRHRPCRGLVTFGRREGGALIPVPAAEGACRRGRARRGASRPGRAAPAPGAALVPAPLAQPLQQAACRDVFGSPRFRREGPARSSPAPPRHGGLRGPVGCATVPAGSPVGVGGAGMGRRGHKRNAAA